MKVAAGSILWLAMVPTALLAQSRPADVPRQIYGKVQVVDATTFEFVKSRQIVRLAGYEAPRLEQTATSDGVEWPAGQVSRAWMILRTLGQNVNCAPVDRDTNKVLIAHCFVGETNLAATAIAEGIGYAFNYRNEPQVAAYFDIERKARGWAMASGRHRTCSPLALHRIDGGRGEVGRPITRSRNSPALAVACHSNGSVNSKDMQGD